MTAALPWLHDVARPTSLRARLVNAWLHRTLKRANARLRTVNPRVVRASRRRLARFEPAVAAVMPRAEVTLVDADGVSAEQVTARDAGAGHTLLLVHGGGYAVGTPALYRGLAARLSRAASCRVLTPAYRLAPEHPFPAALEDARRAWDWLAAHADPERCAVLGDSAGGGLALALLATLRDDGLPRPAAAVTLAPWTDLTSSGRSIVENADTDAILVSHLMEPVARLYLGLTDPENPRVSPLLGRHDGLPPLLMHVSDIEILRDDTLRYAAAVAAAGGAVTVERWPALPHVFHLFAPLLPEANEAIGRVAAFLRRAWRSPGATG